MNPISFAVFILCIIAAAATRILELPISAAAALIALGIFVLFSLKMAQQWEKGVVLRAGKLTQEVTVKAGETKTVEFVFQPK